MTTTEERKKIGDCTFSRGGASTTVAPSGQLVSLTSNQPAFEAGGCRVWEQVTNEVGRDYASTSGTAVRGLVSSTSDSPLAGFPALKLSANQDGVNDVVYHDLFMITRTFTFGERLTASMYVKFENMPASVTNVGFRLYHAAGGSGGIRASINPNTMAWSGSANVDITRYEIIQAGNGFVKIKMEFLAKGNDLTRLRFRAMFADFQTVSIPNNASITYTLAQISKNWDDPVLPTYGTAVTSPKEICTWPTPSELSGNAWSIAATVTPRGITSSFSGTAIACGVIGNYINLYIDSAGDLNYEVGGTSGVLVTDFANGVAKRLVMTKSGTGYTLSVSGASMSFTGSATLDLSDHLYLGSDANGSWQLNGNIFDVRIYPKALTAAQIAEELV